MATNKYGLSRTIPADTKREVRQRDGFGCVVCGSPFLQYEHVDPEFADAHVHDAAKIALLCGGCQARVTSGMLSKDSVKAAMANPKCRLTGFSFGPSDIGADVPEIHVGPAIAERVEVIIRVAGDDILRIEPPEAPGAPFRVTAALANETGKQVLRIDRNELITPVTNWDVQVVGTKITIHNAPRDVKPDLLGANSLDGSSSRSRPLRGNDNRRSSHGCVRERQSPALDAECVGEH